MLQDYKKPKDFESFLYVNHVLQAEGIKFALEGHRGRPAATQIGHHHPEAGHPVTFAEDLLIRNAHHLVSVFLFVRNNFV